jgi:protein-disulfide isomerase
MRSPRWTRNRSLTRRSPERARDREDQDSLFEGRAPTDEIQLSRVAADAGLDVFRYRREMRGRTHAGKVRGIRNGGVRSGVAAAPAFFINSVRHESSFGLATLLAAVQAASGTG